MIGSQDFTVHDAVVYKLNAVETNSKKLCVALSGLTGTLRWNHKSCGAQCTAAVPGPAAGDGGSDGSGFYSFSSTKAKSQKTMEHPTLVLHLISLNHHMQMRCRTSNCNKSEL